MTNYGIINIVIVSLQLTNHEMVMFTNWLMIGLINKFSF